MSKPINTDQNMFLVLDKLPANENVELITAIEYEDGQTKAFGELNWPEFMAVRTHCLNRLIKSGPRVNDKMSDILGCMDDMYPKWTEDAENIEQNRLKNQ